MSEDEHRPGKLPSKLRSLVSLVITLLLGYAVIVLIYVAFQRRLIFAPPPWDTITPKDYGISYQDVEFSSADGTKLHGWWVERPEGPKALTLLYCHGNAANLPALSHVAKLFYDFGWNAFLFDYRGYGKSQKTAITELDVAKDTQAAYDWLKARGYEDQQIIVWGHSLGSSVAARLLTTRSPRAAILEDAFPEIYLLSRFHYPWLLVGRSLIRDKFESAKYLAERGATPLLLIHAERDEVVPLNLGRQLFEQISGPKDWLLIPEIGHSDFPDVAERYRDKIVEFVNQAGRS